MNAINPDTSLADDLKLERRAEVVRYVPVTPDSIGNTDVTAPGDPILSAILQAASDPRVDIEKFRALKAMYDEERAYHAEREFNEAFAAAQAEMEPVVRDRRNTQTNSNYATLDAIAKAITPIYTKHGFAMSFGECDAKKANHLGVSCRLTRGGVARDYQTEVAIDIAGIAGKVNKTPTHAYSSTLTYGRRNLKLMVWDIATQDDDGNAAGGTPVVDTITEEQAATLRDLVEAIGRDESKLIDGFINPAHRRLKLPMITTLDDLPVSRFAPLVKELGDMKRKQAEATANG